MATLAQQLTSVQTAIAEVLTSGNSYHLDSQGKTRAELKELRAFEADLKSQIGMANGSVGVQMQRVRSGIAR